MALQGKTVLLTGASMGIGEAIAEALAREGAKLILISRSEDKLASIAKRIRGEVGAQHCLYRSADVGNYKAVDAAVASALEEVGAIDVLINNAGLALGAPAAFPDLKIADIQTMNSTNINGMMFVTHSVLNRGMMQRKTGTIINVTSVTGLEVPPFSGEAVYHANKACQEAFTNALRNELCGTNIRVMVVRPGCVATNFHSLRVGHDLEQYDKFFEGYTPLVSSDIADAVVIMLKQPEHISIKAMDVVPTAQRSLTTFDREWHKRNAS